MYDAFRFISLSIVIFLAILLDWVLELISIFYRSAFMSFQKQVLLYFISRKCTFLYRSKRAGWSRSFLDYISYISIFLLYRDIHLRKPRVLRSTLLLYSVVVGKQSGSIVNPWLAKMRNIGKYLNFKSKILGNPLFKTTVFGLKHT